MDTREAIRATLDASMLVLKSYVGDFTDSELRSRPGPGCNHVAWQLGHVISANCFLLDLIQPGAAPELPAGFAEKHSVEAAAIDDSAQFYTKQQYLELFGKLNDAIISAVNQQTLEDLDRPAPERFRAAFPTVGHMYILLATHPLMHAGQFVPVRRALGKPVVI